MLCVTSRAFYERVIKVRHCTNSISTKYINCIWLISINLTKYIVYFSFIRCSKSRNEKLVAYSLNLCCYHSIVNHTHTDNWVFHTYDVFSIFRNKISNEWVKRQHLTLCDQSHANTRLRLYNRALHDQGELVLFCLLRKL